MLRKRLWKEGVCMKRSSGEIADEILRRAAALDERDRRRRKHLKTAVLTAACLSLAICLIVLSGRYSGAGPPAQAAVVSLYGEKAGGYVLMAVIGFSAGCGGYVHLPAEASRG